MPFEILERWREVKHDEAWRLTAVFCMRFIRGFEEQILEALKSQHPDIHHEAVLAAGKLGGGGGSARAPGRAHS